MYYYITLKDERWEHGKRELVVWIKIIKNSSNSINLGGKHRDEETNTTKANNIGSEGGAVQKL